MLSDDLSGQDSDYYERHKSRQRRPRKRKKPAQEQTITNTVALLVASLFAVLRSEFTDEEDAFEDLIEPFLSDFVLVRNRQEERLIDVDETGKKVRPLRPAEVTSFADGLSRKDPPSLSEAIVLRKLKLEHEMRQLNIKERIIHAPDIPLTPLRPVLRVPPVNPEVLDALYDIETTPFNNSFLSRLHGTKEPLSPGVIAVDWETRTPWMDLMMDIRDHFTFAHPERECPVEELTPITYSTLHASQLAQVHDLLERSFWSGIDVSDSLDYQPEKTTVVAMYKKIVVGVAILSSPRQTYIMYLAVKSGWDKAQIARTMLYHLITMNPNQDITLHVSVNNSAMLLYNQFGFKAEEFVAGFYSQYLDPQSRASKNAFKLRLRHL